MCNICIKLTILFTIYINTCHAYNDACDLHYRVMEKDWIELLVDHCVNHYAIRPA